MKKNISLITSITLTLFLALSACCKKTEPIILKDALPGTWDFESLKIETNEHMGTVLKSGYIRFESLTGNTGNFHQEVAFIGTRVETLAGTYELMDTPNTVRMEARERTKIITVTIGPKDKFIWEGELDGKKETIIANRRK